MFYVYCYYEVDYDHPIYIGKGSGNRIWDHFQPSVLALNDMFHKKLRSMILNDIRVLVRTLVEGLTEEQALAFEILLIKRYGRRVDGSGCLFNQTIGGDGISGYQHTDVTKSRLSEVLSGQERTNLTRMRMSNGLKRRWQNPEQRERMLESQRERKGIAIESYNLVTLETVKRYRYINEATKDGYRRSNIRAVLRGKTRHHSGLGWRYC